MRYIKAYSNGNKQIAEMIDTNRNTTIYMGSYTIGEPHYYFNNVGEFDQWIRNEAYKANCKAYAIGKSASGDYFSIPM